MRGSKVKGLRRRALRLMGMTAGEVKAGVLYSDLRRRTFKSRPTLVKTVRAMKRRGETV